MLEETDETGARYLMRAQGPTTFNKHQANKLPHTGTASSRLGAAFALPAVLVVVPLGTEQDPYVLVVWKPIAQMLLLQHQSTSYLYNSMSYNFLGGKNGSNRYPRQTFSDCRRRKYDQRG